LSWIVWTAAALLCLEVGLNALRYLLPGFSGPDFIMHNAMARPWLYVHAGCGAVALLVGPAQLLPSLRSRAPTLHRWMGRGYIVACLASGAAGLLLAGSTAAGPVAALGFGLAAVLSLICAGQAWRLAMARRFDEHREWVIRSYALIFAAVTLRLWLPLSQIAHLDFMASYRAISFLAWAPNLAVAEIYLARGRRRTPQPRPAPAPARQSA
jgi:hypothetical protein